MNMNLYSIIKRFYIKKPNSLVLVYVITQIGVYKKKHY